MSRFRNKHSGFTLIEVMVSLLLIMVGILGMLALQGKAIPYTQDSVQRNTAIMLAQDMLELMRSDSANVAQYVKDNKTAFSTAPSACVPTPTAFADRKACWAQRAKALLPGVDDPLLKTGFYICQNATAGDGVNCTGGGNIDIKVVEIRLSWLVKGGECMTNSNENGQASSTCSYTIRTTL